MKISINDKLKELYSSSWNGLSTELNNVVLDNKFEIKPTNPLLLNHVDPDSFEFADIRVMIFGQETNDWEGLFYNDLNKISSVYSEFYQGNRFAHRGHFKNHFNRFVALFENKFPDKKIGFFWNNVIKVGKSHDKGLPPKYILDIVNKEFSVLSEEINIIKPSLILFFSGPDYDQHIIEQIPNLEKDEIEGFSFKKLASFNIKNVDYAFRTYHPNKINFLGKEEYDIIYNKILSKLSFE